MMTIAIILSVLFVLITAWAFVAIKEYSGYSMKNSRSIVITLFIPFYAYFIYSAFLKYPEPTETFEEKIACEDLYYVECGYVIKKYPDTYEHKGTKYTDYFVTYQFLDRQATYEFNKASYDQKKSKDNDCFVRETSYHTTWFFLNILLGCITIAGMVISFIYIIQYIDRDVNAD